MIRSNASSILSHFLLLISHLLSLTSILYNIPYNMTRGMAVYLEFCAPPHTLRTLCRTEPRMSPGRAENGARRLRAPRSAGFGCSGQTFADTTFEACESPSEAVKHANRKSFGDGMECAPQRRPGAPWGASPPPVPQQTPARRQDLHTRAFFRIRPSSVPAGRPAQMQLRGYHIEPCN